VYVHDSDRRKRAGSCEKVPPGGVILVIMKGRVPSPAQQLLKLFREVQEMPARKRDVVERCAQRFSEVVELVTLPPGHENIELFGLSSRFP